MMVSVSPAASPDEETVDPVCGEIFPPELAVFHKEHNHHKYHFCSRTCKDAFEAAPEDFVDPQGSPRLDPKGGPA